MHTSHVCSVLSVLHMPQCWLTTQLLAAHTALFLPCTPGTTNHFSFPFLGLLDISLLHTHQPQQNTALAHSHQPQQNAGCLAVLQTL
jgi:hypothetical protein